MRRTARDYYFIDKHIIKVLNNSPQALTDLAINLMVNQSINKNIPFQAVKIRLRILEEEGRIIRKTENYNGRDVHCFCSNSSTISPSEISG